MSEQEVVEKTSELMRTLDQVRKYGALASAMIEFAAVVVASVVVALALSLGQSAFDVIVGFPPGNSYMSLFGQPVPAFPLVTLAAVLVVLAGVGIAVFWVDRRVKRTEVGEWQEALKEGVPGAVRLLSETDWDSLLSTIRLARPLYLLYAAIKVAAYSLVVDVALLFAGGFGGMWLISPVSPLLLGVLSVVIVLFVTKESLVEGFRRLQPLDLLFWDLRWFSSEFRRAEFNQA